jgi:type VI secretion system protein ImpC
MSEAQQAQADTAVVTQEEGGLLDQIISETRIGRDEDQRAQSRQQIATLVEEVMQGTITVSKDIEAMINTRIADIDELLTRQLTETGGLVAGAALPGTTERDQHISQAPGAQRV